jgi:predicted transposase/invertase (TIGR01784 family)
MTERTQSYGVTTYDAIFKHVLSDSAIRPSFFHAFIPGINVTSSERLDDHMNPLQEFQALRHLLNKEDTKAMIETLRKAYGVDVMVSSHEKSPHQKHEQATAFLKTLFDYCEDLVRAFPKELYDGAMDFVCKLDNGEYALIETQVIVQDYWDKRALAYIAAFYGNQIRKGGDWRQIKRVIGVNILGGGKDDHRHWKETPHQFMRHYMFEEQLHKEPRFIKELQLFQYSIQNEPNGTLTQEQKDWLTFLKEGYRMTEDQVSQIQTEAVCRAFERAKFTNMPKKLREAYEEEDVQYVRISEAMEEKMMEGIAKGKLEERYDMAREMLLDAEPDAKIMKYTKLTIKELNTFKQSLVTG